MHSYGLTNFYAILMIFKQIYLTHRWDPNKYYHCLPSRTGSNGHEGVLQTSQSSKTGASASNVVWCHTQDTPFFGGGGLTHSAGNIVGAF